MFARQISFHGRRMEEIRSAQQKCVRRAFLEPLILLNLEHLLSTPDFSRAAMSRLQIIAAEDIGPASLDLAPRLLGLSEGWDKITFFEKARRLIQAAYLCTQTEASRFVPHWAVTLIKAVPIPTGREEEPTFEALQSDFRQALHDRDLQKAGRCAEVVFLRHPLPSEDHLPPPLHLEKSAMSAIWKILISSCKDDQRERLHAFQTLFGKPSKESISSRLFLYLAIADHVLCPPVPVLQTPDLSEATVEAWLERAKAEAYAIPDWMLDKHTSVGRKRMRGQEQFFAEASLLAYPSSLLGPLESEVTEASKAIYLAEEALYGRESRTKHIRERWRLAAASSFLEGADVDA